MTYFIKSFCLFHDVGALTPRQSSHHLNCGIVWLTMGSLKHAPGMSASVNWTVSVIIIIISMVDTVDNSSKTTWSSSKVLRLIYVFETLLNVAWLIVSIHSSSNKTKVFGRCENTPKSPYLQAFPM